MCRPLDVLPLIHKPIYIHTCGKLQQKSGSRLVKFTRCHILGLSVFQVPLLQFIKFFSLTFIVAFFYLPVQQYGSEVDN